MNRTQRILVVAIAIIAAIAGITWARNTFFRAKDTDLQVASAADVTAEELNQSKADLTVNLDEEIIGKAFPEVSREFLDNSMPNRNRERVSAAGFSTALTFPFTGASQKDDQVYSDEVVQSWWNTELTEELLRNPVYGVAVARALAESKFSDGSTLADINPWLKEFIDKYDSFFAEGGLGNAGFLIRESSAEGAPILVTEEYRRYAVGIRWLLDRFTGVKVKRVYAVKHWGLRPANNLQPSRIKAEAFEDPEDRDAILASLTSKNGNIMLIIGFNVHDKRPEIPGTRPTPTPKPTPQESIPETPQETTPTPRRKTPKPRKKTPKPTPQESIPETPQETVPETPRETTPKETTPRETTPKETTPHETTPRIIRPRKERSKDSVNNGDAQRGGGSSTVGTDPVEPHDPITETGKGHGDPAKETPATPTQDAEHKDVKVDHVDENKMDYQTIPETQSSWKTSDGNNVVTGTQAAGGPDNSSGGQAAPAGTPLTGDGQEFTPAD